VLLDVGVARPREHRLVAVDKAERFKVRPDGAVRDGRRDDGERLRRRRHGPPD
jgi:hypothetical protein